MSEIKESKIFYIVIFSILALALFLRIFYLDLRPFHGDEGVNFIFMDNLIKHDRYRYDPENYHGPILYYLTLIPLSLWGLESSYFTKYFPMNGEYAFRIWSVILGFGVVLILLPLKKWLGKAGLLTAMAFTAISPTAVYYSRDNIHEMYLMFFTIGAFVCGYQYFTTSKSKYLYLSAIFIALMFAAKETTMVTIIIWCLSAIGASLFTSDPLPKFWKRFVESSKGAGKILKKPLFIIFFVITIITLCLILFFQDSYKKYEYKWFIALFTKGIAMLTIYTAFLMFFKNFRKNLTKVLFAWILFFIVLSILFSSFFSHSEGVGKFFKAFELWTHQGTVGSKHTKAFGYYFEILMQVEKPILLFGILGMIFSFWKRKPVDLFTAFFAIGSFLAFSLIPYKTPWCVQNIMLPMFLLTGLFFKYLFEITPGIIYKSLYTIVILVVLFNSLLLSAEVNYLAYDDSDFKIVYVQPDRSALELVKRIEELSNVLFIGKDTKLLMAAPSNLPLNWYLKDQKSDWFQRVMPNSDKYSIIVAERKQEKELDKMLKGNYSKEHYNFNPATGTFMILYYKIEKQVEPSTEFHYFNDTIDISGDEKKLNPGLLGTVYSNANFHGRKKDTVVDEKIQFIFNSEEEKTYKAPFSILWEGLIKIPKNGDYTFSSSSDDGSFVYIDNRMIVDNGGEHGIEYKAKQIYLAKGYHKIKVKYFDVGGGAIMELKWMQPSQSASELLNSDYIFHIE